MLVATSDGVCHSVAYHLGCRRGDGANSGDGGDSTAVAGKFECPVGVPTPGAFLLAWPLSLFGMLRTTPREERRWIAGKLHHFGSQIGLCLAMSMAEALEQKILSFSDKETFIIGDWYPR